MGGEIFELAPTSRENSIGSLMNEDTETLAELMLHADQFCSKVEAATQDVAPNPEEKELRTKIGPMSEPGCVPAGSS